MYSKEAHLNDGHNSANKKRIGVHTPEKTSQNYPNIGIRTIKLNIDRFGVVHFSIYVGLNASIESFQYDKSNPT